MPGNRSTTARTSAYVSQLSLENFSAFSEGSFSFSPGINVLLGENGSGKTHLMKLIYSCLYIKNSFGLEYLGKRIVPEKAAVANAIESKLMGVFRPAHLGRLATRRQGKAGSVKIDLTFSDNASMAFGFGQTKKEARIDIRKTPGWQIHSENELTTPIFLPTKEVLSLFPGFGNLLKLYDVPFSEVYGDVVEQLQTPLQRGPATDLSKKLLKNFKDLKLNVSFDKNEQKFKVESLGKKLEATLTSEGIRKLAVLLYLIRNGTLSGNSVLFWDEPEANLNPKWTEPIIKFLFELANEGVQIFIATHDYLFIRLLSLEAEFQHKNKLTPDIQFFNFIVDKKDKNKVSFEKSGNIFDFEEVPILDYYQEFFRKERAYYAE